MPERSSTSRQEDKAGIGGDRSSLELYRNGPVKIRLDYLLLAFTHSEHLRTPRFALYASLYQVVDHNST